MCPLSSGVRDNFGAVPGIFTSVQYPSNAFTRLVTVEVFVLDNGIEASPLFPFWGTSNARRVGQHEE